ncbi:hypothetical protein [Mucilaginibacter endophyticus]|uniref:hypothetical protein n=1 Tax=Mucilaginibacter endophyticus TaxID=2675003 RepID=UPI000E0CF66B|nr:hypothetical protein [Mucilaginibacter endophyticus]
MKILKLNHLIILLSLFLASCATTSYLGDTYPATEKVDVFYDAKDVKKDYKVIGHLAIAYTPNAAEAKNDLSIKAREVGADGIIILQVDGNNEKATIRADAIKYNK